MKEKRIRKWFVKTATFDLLSLEDSSVLSYAYIFHDKETTTPHYHICIEFKDGKTMTAVKRFLSADSTSTADVWNTDGALRYLIHADQPDKYQYPISLVKLRGMTLSRFEKTTFSPISTCEVYFLLQGRFNRSLEVFAEQPNVGKLINLIKSSGFRPGCFNLKNFAKTLKRVSDIKNGVIKMNKESPAFAFLNTQNLIKQLPYSEQQKFYNALEVDAENFIDVHRNITLSKLESDKYQKGVVYETT